MISFQNERGIPSKGAELVHPRKEYKLTKLGFILMMAWFQHTKHTVPLEKEEEQLVEKIDPKIEDSVIRFFPSFSEFMNKSLKKYIILLEKERNKKV